MIMDNPDPRDRAAVLEGAGASDNLALLYQGLLTGIGRMQSRRQHIPDAEAFRRRTKAALQQVERDAAVAGYDSHDIRDTHFAVVAFLDAVILNSNDPVRSEWERRTLQEELFDKTDAGVVFFEKLDHFQQRRDSPQLADLLEVYLLCLLLGFEGRYVGGRGELTSISESVRRRIDDIRGRTRHISPSCDLPAQNSPPVQANSRPQNKYLRVALMSIAITIACYLAFKMDLISSVAQARSRFF